MSTNKKLIRALAANFRRKMLMMLQLCQVMVMISFSSSVSLLASDQLHPGEVEALRQIGRTVNKDGQLSLKFVDRCQQKGFVQTELNSAPPDLEGNSTIECNCSITDDNYCHITSFQLKGYGLPGRLPPELAILTYVQKIDFTRNYLYGTIPVEWASMKYLSFISLTANRLSGNIPAHLGRFTALTYLSLESNQFSGVVPPELGKLVSLKTLILSGNKLAGTLPEELAQIKNLKDFRVSDNNLNGTVPEFIGNWTQLQKLELYATGLQGPIPLEIFHLEKLFDLRIADMPGPEFQLPNVAIRRDTLVLRNINLNGTIPEGAWKVEKTLDLTFNKLVGEIPPNTIRRQFTFLSGNKLTGTVQEPFLQNSQNLDVSYNNFSRSPRCSSSTENNINWFRSSSSYNNLSDLLPCSGISRCPKYYRSFYINCGGQDVKNGRILYEGDQDSESNAAARSYYRLGSNWGFSSTGDFMDDNNFNDNKYTLQSNSNISLVDFGLYATARKTPLSITYYGYCLENGNYTVRLHFAEIQFTDEKLYNKVARRVFDIYIQGIQVRKDFNFTEEAKGSNRNFTIAFNTTVTDRTLEIRLYWAGKGTTVIPRRGNYGPIISAISVCSEPEETSKKPIVIGVVTSAAFLVLLVMGVIYWKLCYGHKYTRERELKGLDLKTGSFTLRQLKATPDNFNSENKIGEDGLGSVYKGETSSLI